ncbi:DEAD/DEAH box helicase [Cellvibrio sp. PSBB006]|uniref:DEAD/DEAH box helicase n=1 Tax=Cellvibrio sp. PSBB006 TaxID=1987723 RepID=UPI000B3B62B5|nr:AAA domain-containing protein [Cellvibrio sp. PSBB006]ARU29450.1 hypothetical protein CBR65_19515 [Cellvibrio sp. PSBB006]
MSFNKQRAINILSYWHQIEFFNCIDLKDLRNGKEGVIHYSGDVLASDPNCLPWLNRENIRRAGRGYKPDRQYTYTLYLGIFKNSEFFDQAKNYFGDEGRVDWEERKSEAGSTCVASFKLSKEGSLLLDTLEMSTAPWALGQVIQGNIDNIRFDDFEKECEKLLHKFQSLEKLASNLKESINLPHTLTTFEIVEILKILGDWSGFEPQHQDTAIIIKLNPLARDQSQPPQNTYITAESVLKLQQLSNELAVYEDISSVEEEPVYNHFENKNITDDELKVSILNSFFLRDLERARDLVQQDKLDVSSPLLTYLSSTDKRNPDLLSPEGEKIIRSNVLLPNTPLGRWPSDSANSMSLMQQFAINTIDQDLNDQGLYSVNGPPGTGKTTMLRDLVANNIVNRARIISGLDHPHSAFLGDITVKVGGNVRRGVKRLIPELAGYEMVVVSNNNSAVENISKELPQSRAVGKEFGNLNYLKPVAQKLAAQHDDKNNIHPLAEDDDCWGLVSAALGNSDNRKAFGAKIQFSKIESLNHIDESSKNYSTLVPAIKALIKSCGDVHINFKAVQKEFLQAEKNVKYCISEISCLEAIVKAEKERDRIASEISQLKERILATKFFLSKMEMKKTSIVRTKKWCRRITLIKAFRLRVEHKKLEIERLETKWFRLNASILQDKEKNKALYEKHDGITFGCNLDNLECKETQRSTFGHSRALNKARSELTIKAFNLHQAWLVASYEGCFSSNVNIFNDLVTGNIKDYEHAKIVWQSFFMVIPVVSSAFASVANQFSKLHGGDIGWLFIDEAGQATPQQAVGAVMRSRRVVVVGDPLQVEPVFTTPPEFVEYFGKKLLGEDWDYWSPTIASVQTVADEVNPYGTRLISQEFWLGSPLRVHRRCKDPMFTIANEIAYNNKMIHGSDDVVERGEFIWGNSCWFDVYGEVTGKHYVAEQGVFVLQLLYRYHQHNGQLPDCYIISPFKDVTTQLLSFLKRNFHQPTVDKDQFSNWLRGRVGTVHTFQGKEEKVVLLVLGASFETKGAATWASSKPNLLNVAVTRAKDRIFLIGSEQVWGSLSHFSFANSQLPTRTINENAETLYA